MKFLFTIIIICAFSIGCDKTFQSSEMKGERISPMIPLGYLGFGADTLSYHNGCYSELKDMNFIINNNSEYNVYKNYASCLKINNWPSIDFRRYTMLAGIRKEGASVSRIIPEKFSLTNLNGNYKFIVTINHGSYWQMMTVYYWILTDKISPDSNVEFIIEYVNPYKIQK